MEQRSENPIFGRKVFFINPPLQFERVIIAGLRDQEFEVYVIHDYKNCKPILRQNRDAMCFIFIDDGMSYLDWFKYVKSFQYEDDLRSIFIGLMSSKIHEKEKNFFLLNVVLPGGFTMLNVSNDILYRNIFDNLILNGAKGRRQYIRLETAKMPEVKGFIRAAGKLFPFEVQNISSVGFAIKCHPLLTQVFVKNTVVENISCSLGNQTTLVSVVVFDTKIVDGKCSSVLLLRNPSQALKNFIRNFIFSKLDSRLEYDISVCLKDTTDYHEMKLPENKNDVVVGPIEEMDAVDLEDTRDVIIHAEKEVRDERNLETNVVKDISAQNPNPLK